MGAGRRSVKREGLFERSEAERSAVSSLPVAKVSKHGHWIHPRIDAAVGVHHGRPGRATAPRQGVRAAGRPQGVVATVLDAPGDTRRADRRGGHCGATAPPHRGTIACSTMRTELRRRAHLRRILSDIRTELPSRPDLGRVLSAALAEKRGTQPLRLVGWHGNWLQKFAMHFSLMTRRDDESYRGYGEKEQRSQRRKGATKC